MSEQFPAPPVPAECDLREFGFTPIYRARLFGSDFHANTTDSEWRAGVTLWLKSWEQVPAGSLPSDDVGLARLAEFARDIKGWRKVKAGALHGWFQCSDGRFYHEVVAKVVLEAWLKKRKASDKGKAGASKRWHSGNAQADSTGMPQLSENMPQALAQASPQLMPADSNGREGKGIEGKGQGRDVRTAHARGEIESTANGHDPVIDSLPYEQAIQAAFPTGPNPPNWTMAIRNARDLVDDKLSTWPDLVAVSERYARYLAGGGASVNIAAHNFFDRRKGNHWQLPWDPPATKAQLKQDANLDAARTWLAQSEAK